MDVSKPFRPLMRIPVPWVFQLVFLIGTAVQFLLPAAVRFPEGANGFRIAGAVLFAAGVALAGWSLVIFHRERTTTVPGKMSAVLVVRGPYRFVRNPMYVSLILAYLGEAGLLVQAGPVFLLPLIVAYVNWVVVPVEETLLNDAFGEAYQRYRARVGRWI